MYLIDIFTPEWVGTKFPVNSFSCDNDSELLKVVKDCMKKDAGIAEIQIFNVKDFSVNDNHQTIMYF